VVSVTPTRLLTSLVAFAVRRPLPVLAATALLVLAGAALALRLEPAAGTDTLVGKGTRSFAATELLHDRFGDEGVYVLVQESVPQLVLTPDLERLIGLEGCLSGNRPKGAKVPGGERGPCARLARDKPVRVVFGPGTFVNTSVLQIQAAIDGQIQAAAQKMQSAGVAARKVAKARGYSKADQDKAASQASQLVQSQFLRDAYQLALQYGIQPTTKVQISNTDLVSHIVLSDSAKTPGTPKQRFAYLFPTRDAALIQVRLKPGLSERQRTEAIGLIRAAVAMPVWKLAGGGSYTVTGAPVVVSDLTASITHSLLVLLVAALLVMAATLALVFRARPRLLPLAIALAAAALTFGALSLAGASLTMASIAVLPVLIGLGVDYAIQLHSRVDEEGGDPVRAAALGAPTVATAAAATAAGFLVLVLSPVPMVRGFGILLVIGIALAFLAAMTAGTAILVRTRGGAAGAGASAVSDGPRSARGRLDGIGRALRSIRAALQRAVDPIAASGRGARELLTQTRPGLAVRDAWTRASRASFDVALRRPGRVLAVAFAVALAGWALDTQTRVESDIQKLVPQDLPALTDLRQLERATGIGGEIDVVVSGDHLTDPKVVSWMTSYQTDVLKRFGYTATRGCGKAELCPAFSLPDLFKGGGAPKTETQVRDLLGQLPPYFSQAVITSDHRTATLAFGIRLMPLDQQERVVEEMRARLRPPAGVRAQLAGLPVLTAEANAKVSSSWRRLLQLVAGLVAVGLVLLVALRTARRALVPLVPIALATGWSAAILFLLRIPLNPLSVTLGALVIAISTEFSVLLAERFRQERLAGHDAAAALERTYRFTGRAVAASGVTAIAGFAVLVLSDIRMLRDFGLVTVIDLTVSLLGVMVVLPAVLLLAEQGRLLAWVPARVRRLRLRPRTAP
jgi:hydrophobe/amphiphile efflux-3 (HAE3) family protein